jgi:uncharacterized protein (DUF1015 family)
MANIIPFKGLRPTKELAPRVATLPYDVVSVAEAAAFGQDPYNFYHVTRSEIDLPAGTDVHSAQVYNQAQMNLDAMIKEGVLFRENKPCYYIYCLVMNGRAQTGLICGSSLEDYFKGIIKKHEFTRPEKEQDRIEHIQHTQAQTGVVFLAYNDNQNIEQIISDWKNNHKPEYDFTAPDGIQHTLWVVNEDAVIEAISNFYSHEVPCTYIADGHHRAASAAKVCLQMRENNPSHTGKEPYNYFITCIFPASQLHILDYNRVVKDLNGLNADSLLNALQKDFVILECGTEAFKPKAAHQFGMYLAGKWYQLNAKEGAYSNDPIGVLDVSILQQNVLSGLLGIDDPRTDKRIDFVGGIRGLVELEKRVNSGEMAVAFSLYPVSIQQLFTIADNGNVMPPKSTWFEPKLRDGLVVYCL